jgi:oxalate decarboxylase
MACSIGISSSTQESIHESDLTAKSMAASAVGGLLTAANSAAAQSGPVPQPQRPGRGGTDPGPRNLLRDRQNPDLLVPPSTDHGTLPNSAGADFVRS